MPTIVTPPFSLSNHTSQHQTLASTASNIRAGGLLRRTRALTVIDIGDSITANSTVYSNGQWQFGSGYAETSIRLAGPRFRQISNAGIPGQTSTQIAARFQSDVVALNPDIVIILAGTNDYVSGMANSAYTTLMNNIQSMVVQSLAANILPIVVVPPPRNTATIESRRARVFYYTLAQFWNVPLFDIFAICADPITGGFISGYSDDGTHPNATAIAAIAAKFGPFLQNIDTQICAPYYGIIAETSAGNPANLIRNGSFAKITTPPAPDGWTINTTNATYTTPASTWPYTGNTFTYVKTGSGLVFVLSGSSIGSSFFSAGDTIQFNGFVSATGRSGATGFTIGMDIATSLGNARPLTAWVQDGGFAFSQNFTIPSGAINVTPTLTTSDIGTFGVSNLTAINVTALSTIWAPS